MQYTCLLYTSIEQGFANAVAGANKAIVVTTPEVSAIRDADRIIGLLEAQDLRDISLVINRIRPDMVKRGEMMSVDDVQEILAVPLLGILPDDEQVVICLLYTSRWVEETGIDGRSRFAHASPPLYAPHGIPPGAVFFSSLRYDRD